MAKWKALEQKIYEQLKAEAVDLQGRALLVGLSGGKDSLAALCSLQALQETLGVVLYAAYVHHGSNAFSSYRDEAQIFCEKLCQSLQIPFFTRKSKKSLSSEEEMREYRHQALREIAGEIETKNPKQVSTIIVLAHHREDLLETRLLRLIRGTGLQGLSAMEFFNGQLLRPLLYLKLSEISQYLQEVGQVPLADPSNENADYLRNWLRQEWLPVLEQKQPGALAALAQSLENISAQYSSQNDSSLWVAANEIHLPLYWALSRHQQREILAQMLLKCRARDFTRGQIEEIQKRLDTSPKEHTFDCATVRWTVNAQHRLRAVSLGNV